MEPPRSTSSSETEMSSSNATSPCTRNSEDRSSAVGGGVSLTLLSSCVDARFDKQAARFDELGTRIDTCFDEQAARMDVINTRFDSLQADNTRLQAAPRPERQT